jgi:HipA-like protein
VPRAYLFNVRTIQEDPAHLNSADAELIVTGEDGMDYVVKTTTKHPGIPASEWIGHSLADACGIPTPQYAFIELADQRIGFGSQWDASALTDPVLRTKVFLTAGAKLQHLAIVFSSIFALDQFVYNDDRHANNYFLVATGRSYGVKAYDFSRALLYHGWPPPALPLPPGCNTIGCYRALRVGYPYDPAGGEEVIRKLKGLSATVIRQWLNDMPSVWLTAAKKAQFCDWWENDGQDRLEEARKGLGNGTFL